MGSLKIDCPLPTALSDITATLCKENFGQIVKIAFQRKGSTFADITDEAEWDAYLTAPQVGPPASTDAQKIIITPFAENVILPAGELITEGGDDNTTLFGAPISVGKGTVNVTGRHRGISSTTKRDLEQLVSESSVQDALTVFLINEFGQVIGQDVTGASSNAQSGFPIGNYFISDVDSQGLNTNNLNNFSWTFKGGWSDFFVINTLTWDILSK